MPYRCVQVDVVVSDLAYQQPRGMQMYQHIPTTLQYAIDPAGTYDWLCARQECSYHDCYLGHSS